ncbi:MAG TPA: lysylphosphatidylglycerol synthase transmembrane domain-containing protein [Polyangiaceae bacterium]|nr:lysylphosphatidylglycerol synthase transmembrane domain-containing protein [Polyangiaceae bacterium]
MHAPSGDVRVAREACAKLSCEPGLASTLQRARLGLLATLFGAYLLGTVAWAARWRVLLTLAGVSLSLGETWRLIIRAQAAGILMPGGVGGDALRIGFLVGRGARTSIVVASVLLDRAIGLVTLATIAGCLGLAVSGDIGEGPAGRLRALTYVLLCFPLVFPIGIALLRSPWLRRRVGVAALEPTLDYAADPKAPRAFLRAFLVSLVVSAVQIGVIRGLVATVGASPLAEKWVYVGSAMGMIVSAVPALPGGWGTADAAYVFFLGELGGLGAGVALAVCLLYRVFWYLSGALGAILQVVPGGTRRT